MTPTIRHLQNAKGYIDLGMVNEASDELEAIDWDDRMKPEILAMRVDLYCAAKNWELMRDVAKHLAEGYPDQSQWWVHRAYVLRERGLERLGGVRRLPGRLDLAVMIRPCTL